MKILIAGEGGQGVQVIAEILAKAAFSEGKSVLYIPNFGVEQRGGVSVAFLTIENKPIGYPKFIKADIIAVLSDRSWSRINSHQKKDSQIILGPGVKNGLKTSFPSKIWNILILGQINKLNQIVSLETLIDSMNERFAKQYLKYPELKELNLRALNQ